VWYIYWQLQVDDAVTCLFLDSLHSCILLLRNLTCSCLVLLSQALFVVWFHDVYYYISEIMLVHVRTIHSSYLFLDNLCRYVSVDVV
jgi:hypothetical protein